MNSSKILYGKSYLPYLKPKKLIFMLHGYGDSAENFVNVAKPLESLDFEANYFALNAPLSIPNYSVGRQWFDLHPNGIYIAEAGINEIKIIQSEILSANVMLKNTIDIEINKYNLSYKDCFLIGFSQGGMMVFEFGNYFKNTLGGLAILSGRILSKENLTNPSLLYTPIFISHGDSDEILPLKVYEQACNFLRNNKLFYESHILKGDTHTISLTAIKLLQKFIKKNL